MYINIYMNQIDSTFCKIKRIALRKFFTNYAYSIDRRNFFKTSSPSGKAWR